jgi:hypothetical protein
MVVQKMPLLNAAFFLLGQLSEHLAQMPAQVSIHHLTPAFGYENSMVLHRANVLSRSSYAGQQPTPSNHPGERLHKNPPVSVIRFRFDRRGAKLSLLLKINLARPE